MTEAGKLEMPALGLDGMSSFVQRIAAEMLGEVASNSRVGETPRRGHGIAGENATALLDGLSRFLE